MNVTDAKARVDMVIAKSRADMYKPIAIAEILFRLRTAQADISVDTLDSYRRPSYRWMLEVIGQLHNKTTQLNSRYWDQLFDDTHINRECLQCLHQSNADAACVERYIYAILRSKFTSIGTIIHRVRTDSPSSFSLRELLDLFRKDSQLARSIDRVYECVVYALFESITRALNVTVTLSIQSDSLDLLADFERFTKVVLGIDVKNPKLSHRARLYRVGTANQADAGLDMWANFGPAIQVKHISLREINAEAIQSSIRADRFVIVCRDATDATGILNVVNGIGEGPRLQGVITESDLIDWYSMACSPKYVSDLGNPLLKLLEHELNAEFALANQRKFDDFFDDRGYSSDCKCPDWQPMVG